MLLNLSHTAQSQVSRPLWATLTPAGNLRASQELLGSLGRAQVFQTDFLAEPCCCLVPTGRVGVLSKEVQHLDVPEGLAWYCRAAIITRVRMNQIHEAFNVRNMWGMQWSGTHLPSFTGTLNLGRTTAHVRLQLTAWPFYSKCPHQGDSAYPCPLCLCWIISFLLMLWRKQNGQVAQDLGGLVLPKCKPTLPMKQPKVLWPIALLSELLSNGKQKYPLNSSESWTTSINLMLTNEQCWKFVLYSLGFHIFLSSSRK